jgi:hypothetical protein
MEGAKKMPSQGEEVVDHSVDGEEPLGLRNGLEAPQMVLPSAGRLV